MRAVLRAEVRVEHFAAFAEMAWLERRPELGLLCRAACDDETMRISASTVSTVLPGLPEAGVHNVVRWCATIGLCDAHGGLTALGHEVATSDLAPVPEQGVYAFWLARHPLLGNRLLAVERLASRRDGRFSPIEPLTAAPDRGCVFRSVLAPEEHFVFRDFPTNHGDVGMIPRVPQPACRIQWVLDLDHGRDLWQLDGALEGAQHARAIQHEPEHDGLDLWALVERWGEGPLARFGRWDPAARRLAVSIVKLTVDEQDRFVKTLTLDHAEVTGKGHYEDVLLEEVPIGPASVEDAQRWAMGRLWRRLEDGPRYRSRRDVRALFVDLCGETPLAPYAPTLPAHAELLGDERITRDPEVYWSLAAPVDLAPDAPTTEQLGELRLGDQP